VFRNVGQVLGKGTVVCVWFGLSGSLGMPPMGARDGTRKPTNVLNVLTVARPTHKIGTVQVVASDHIHVELLVPGCHTTSLAVVMINNRRR
jgi:hypothetical protein